MGDGATAPTRLRLYGACAAPSVAARLRGKRDDFVSRDIDGDILPEAAMMRFTRHAAFFNAADERLLG